MKNMTYKISVVKTDDGKYLVNHYDKRPDKLIPTFRGVVSQLYKYALTPEIFIEEPVLIDLNHKEKSNEH